MDAADADDERLLMFGLLSAGFCSGELTAVDPSEPVLRGRPGHGRRASGSDVPEVIDSTGYISLRPLP